MLASLSVRNFAIIENINIDFFEGMTALTGETGAGKSLLIDAINLLLGERAQTDLVRKGYDKAIIEGVFFYDNEEIDVILNNNGLDSEEHSLLIRREISNKGNNIVRINNNMTTLSVLKEIGDLLADIHTQGDSYRIIKKSNYIKMIDNMGVDSNILKTYQSLYHDYISSIRRLEELEKENEKTELEIEFYQFQLDELRKANISIEEEQDIQSKLDKLENYDKIYAQLKETLTNLEANNIDGLLFHSASKLEKISKYDDTLQQDQVALLNSYYEVLEVMNHLKSSIQELDFNPGELEQLHAREREYKQLQRKYKKNTSELLEYLVYLEDKIEQFEQKDHTIEKQHQIIKDQFQSLLVISNQLSNERKKISQQFSRDIITFLQDLELKQTRFDVVFKDRLYQDELDEQYFFQNGADDIEFMISMNIGEDQKPLSKTASGGEMSRFMLALKAILLKKQHLTTIIFDEIDTGISGEVAFAIAQKMKMISIDTQTLCITHIPQVAALSDHHYFISKHEKDGRTITNITKLNDQERIINIAKMISGDVLTQEAKQMAIQLINKKNT